MDAGTVELAVKLLPSAISLAQELGHTLEKARDEGYEVPGIERVEEMNELLRKLPDLAPAKEE